jgi:type II secretory pathway component GspD/PulD (secretin)
VADSTATVSNLPPVVAAVGIPQIKFSDVPITTAIENLARLANINYQMDPKIGYGQPDANGQLKPEPTLSIRWENITAENALLALLDNWGLQMIYDKHTGIDRITMKDPTAPPTLFTKVIQLKYASVSNMINAAQSVLLDKRSRVLMDARTSQLVVVGTDAEQVAVETLVNQLDKPTRQVLIETRLVEISTNPKTKKGVDWSGTLTGQHINFGNGTMAGTWDTTMPGSKTVLVGGKQTTKATDNSQSGILNNLINPGGAGSGGGFSWNTKSGTTPSVGFLNADGLSAVLSFINSSSEAQIMSTPRIVTLDNEMANISVTRGYPIFSVQTAVQGVSGNGSSVTYSNIGTILQVTPRISANDYIWLKVVPEVSSFFGNFAGPNGLTAPVFDSRRMETQVLIPNSNTLVLGGLVQDSPRADYTKVPLLGDIPGLGFFFRSEDKAMAKDNLLVFITPTIVKDTDFQTSKSGDFLNTKPEALKQTMNPNNAWDSPVPKGVWSDPINETTK